MDFFQDLNEKQIEVVRATEGPILVLAGAGSGKTRALTCRVAYLIKEKGIAPENILAITFTNKAAKEMANRVGQLIQNTKDKTQSISAPVMGTFHSVCARILRADGEAIGLGRNFVIYDEADSLKVIKDILKKLNMGEDKISPRAIRSYISSAKNELLGPAQYDRYAKGYFQETVAKVYPDYQKELKKNNALDFDDLLSEAVKLFQEAPQILEKYQKRWQYLLIDEYQDTNHSQYIFAKLLAQYSRNICVVGDDWQSIYGFRGANFQNILDFEKDWPGAKVIKLEQNYRSTKTILAAAQNVIESNQERSKKTLWTENTSGHPIDIYEAKDEEDESRFICSEIERLKSSGKSYQDVAVFYRTNAQSRILEEQLLRAQIPYKIVGGVRFYERKEIKDLLAWLKIASGANDFVSFERSTSCPPCGIGEKSIAKLKELTEKEGLEIGGLKGDEKSLAELGEKTAKHFIDHFRKVEKIREASKKSLKEGIKTAIKISGLSEYYSDGSFASEERLENLNELLSVAEEYELLKGKLTLSDFLAEVALISDIDNYQEDSEGITLMTIHVSKGLEFKTVFICGLEENIFPHSRSLFEPAQIEEERRLFYVGITRARENLYLLYARTRLYFGSRKSNLPSRFLTEIPEGLINLINTTGFSGVNLEVPEERVPGNIKVGDTVEHEHFGKGAVISVCEDELTVDFGDIGQKIVSLYYAPIKKV